MLIIKRSGGVAGYPHAPSRHLRRGAQTTTGKKGDKNNKNKNGDFTSMTSVDVTIEENAATACRRLPTINNNKKKKTHTYKKKKQGKEIV